MNIGTIISVVSLVWLISEIVLARVKHSSSTSSKLDKSSLRLLWTTIVICVSLGVFLGIHGIGFISTGSYYISLFGLFLIVSGLVVRCTAIITLRKYFTVDVSVMSDHRVINKGIYRIVRHPAYGGSMLSFLGLGLVFSNWLTTLVIFIPIGIAFVYRIKVEENALARFLGDEYLQYSTATKRLIPKIY